MLKKLTSLMLTILMINAAVFANQTGKRQEDAEKVKSQITKLGTGTKAKVSVKFKDGSKIKGYVSEIKSDSFVVANKKTGSTSEVSYSQVEQVKRSGLSRGQSTALGIGLGAVLIVGVLYLVGIAAARYD